MLRIADQAFPFEETQFLAYVSPGQAGWQVTWRFEFQGIQREIDGADWRPKVSSHALEVAFPPLLELPGFGVELALSEDEEPPFILYVFEHEPLLNGRVEFGAWNDGKIHFLLVGTADVLADEKYGAELPVQIECELPFDGVVVDEGHVEKAEEKFARFFERQQFASPERHENGGFHFRLRARNA
jgi:hypothetical protein